MEPPCGGRGFGGDHAHKGGVALPVAPPSEQQLAVAVDLEDAAQALLGRGQALLGALP